MILGLDTSTEVLGLALLKEGRVVQSLSLAVGRRHSEKLPGALDRFLNEAGAKVTDLSGLAVSLGPGSFTGLRVGLSFTKGLAQALELPLVGVPTLLALAWRFAPARLPIGALLDARKGEVFCAIFHEKEGGLLRMTPDRALSPEAFISEIKEPTLLVGSGVRIYGDFLKTRLGPVAIFVSPNPEAPDPSDIAYLGWQRLKQGERDDLEKLEPVYVRASDAELKFKTL
jgi:tRNA threonylcarbamoyladenosine biosynthesis protein TsaB